MAWLDSTYKKRRAFSVVTTSSGSTVDVVLTIPPGWDEFWDGIDANGYGIRFTEADGVTPIDYQLQTWTPASNIAVVNLDDVPMPGSTDKCVLLWMYYAPTGTATDGSTSFTLGASGTASMEMAQPDPASAIRIREQTPGQTVPDSRIAKSEDEVRDVFFALTRTMQPASTTYNGRRQWEEPGVASIEVQDSSGTPVASMNEVSAMRWVSVDRGGGRQDVYLRARVKAGTTATKYTLIATVLTATPQSSPTYRTLTTPLGVQVKNQLES